jgi:hypothetical protein
MYTKLTIETPRLTSDAMFPASIKPWEISGESVATFSSDLTIRPVVMSRTPVPEATKLGLLAQSLGIRYKIRVPGIPVRKSLIVIAFKAPKTAIVLSLMRAFDQ